jgi:hypothetical protein
VPGNAPILGVGRLPVGRIDPTGTSSQRSQAQESLRPKFDTEPDLAVRSAPCGQTVIERRSSYHLKSSPLPAGARIALRCSHRHVRRRVTRRLRTRPSSRSWQSEAFVGRPIARSGWTIRGPDLARNVPSSTSQGISHPVLVLAPLRQDLLRATEL